MKGSIFIAVRQGEYSCNKLTLVGEVQMREVAQRIEAINTSGKKIVLLCSTAPRASEGGKIFIKELGISTESAIFKDFLWDNGSHFADVAEAKKLVEENLLEDTILLVLSDFYLVSDLLNYVAKIFGYEKRFYSPEFGKGSIIDSEGIKSFP